MPRRSWRDLERTPGGAAAARPASPVDAGGGSARDLHQAAELAPESPLRTLVEEREALERRLRGLSGVSGAGSQDPDIAARFPVASFAERRADEQAWAMRRAALQDQRDHLRRQARDPGAADTRPASSSRDAAGLGPSPLEARMSAGLPDMIGGLGPGAMRSMIGSRARRAGDRIPSRSASARSGLGRVREELEPLDRVGRPLRDFGRSLETAQGQLRDLDRQLADEGVSAAEREEIRKALKGDEIDKVGGKIAKANEALDAPRKIVDKVENEWVRREEQMTGPMDRLSSYAGMRERRLSPETGGSGDLFERMLRNRQRALQRRRDQQDQEERDRRRRERAGEVARDRREADRRNERSNVSND
ncbi:MAG: hypothetical protein AAF501_02435 [Pseudomonadota bacterium]